MLNSYCRAKDDESEETLELAPEGDSVGLGGPDKRAGGETDAEITKSQVRGCGLNCLHRNYQCFEYRNLMMMMMLLLMLILKVSLCIRKSIAYYLSTCQHGQQMGKQSQQIL